MLYYVKRHKLHVAIVFVIAFGILSLMKANDILFFSLKNDILPRDMLLAYMTSSWIT